MECFFGGILAMSELQLQENYIYNTLRPIFKEQGYTFFPQQKQFRFASRNGYRAVLIHVNGNSAQQSIDLQLGIRLDVVEELVNQFLQGVSMGCEESATIIASYSRLVHNPCKRFLVTDAADLESVCLRMAAFMQSSGFRFLESFDRLRKIDGLLNRKPEQSSPFLQNQMIRCFKGLVIAKLTHRTDFNQLAKTYFTFLNKHWADQSVTANYKRLVKFLRFFSIN